MNFIRNRNFRAGPQTSLEGFICPQNSDKLQKNKVFGRSEGGYQMIILDKDTYKDYVDIPDVILKKLAEGKISFTHFSDILSFALLMNYVGWWMDATIYPIHKIENIDTVYSVKSSSQTEYISEC